MPKVSKRLKLMIVDLVIWPKEPDVNNCIVVTFSGRGNVFSSRGPNWLESIKESTYAEKAATH